MERELLDFVPRPNFEFLKFGSLLPEDRKEVFYTDAQTYTLGDVAEKLYLDESYTGNKETLKPYLSEEFKAEHEIV